MQRIVSRCRGLLERRRGRSQFGGSRVRGIRGRGALSACVPAHHGSGCGSGARKSMHPGRAFAALPPGPSWRPGAQLAAVLCSQQQQQQRRRGHSKRSPQHARTLPRPQRMQLEPQARVRSSVNHYSGLTSISRGCSLHPACARAQRAAACVRTARSCLLPWCIAEPQIKQLERPSAVRAPALLACTCGGTPRAQACEPAAAAQRRLCRRRRAW